MEILDLKTTLFLIGCVLFLILSLCAASLGKPMCQNYCLFAFWGYLGWVDLVVSIKEKRRLQKNSDL